MEQKYSKFFNRARFSKRIPYLERLSMSDREVIIHKLFDQVVTTSNGVYLLIQNWKNCDERIDKLKISRSHTSVHLSQEFFSSITIQFNVPGGAVHMIQLSDSWNKEHMKSSLSGLIDALKSSDIPSDVLATHVENLINPNIAIVTNLGTYQGTKYELKTNSKKFYRTR